MSRTGKALYAGSFDPVTAGHAWMIQEGCRLFGRHELVVCMAVNPAKKYTFSADDRCTMLETVVAEAGVRTSIDWVGDEFLVDYAVDVGAKYLLRGIRSTADTEYERAMRNVNGDREPGVTTVFLMPPRELCEVSSSMVKGLVGPANWESMVQRYVPSVTMKFLQEWSKKR